MKQLWILLLTLSLSTATFADRRHKNLSLGGLELGQSTGKIVHILGEPTSKGEFKEEAATGEVIQRWSYPNQGLELDVSKSEGHPLSLYRIYAKSPCDLGTYQGIHIGTFDVEVRALAKRLEGKEGLEVTQGEGGYGFLWIDSYQLLSVTVEGNKVTEIYLGPGPE